MVENSTALDAIETVAQTSEGRSSKSRRKAKAKAKAIAEMELGDDVASIVEEVAVPSYVDEAVMTPIPILGGSEKTMLVPDTPAVLSMGRKVMEAGYDFVWMHKDLNNPYFRQPDGKTFKLKVVNAVPILDKHTVDLV